MTTRRVCFIILMIAIVLAACAYFIIIRNPAIAVIDVREVLLNKYGDITVALNIRPRQGSGCCLLESYVDGERTRSVMISEWISGDVLKNIVTGYAAIEVNTETLIRIPAGADLEYIVQPGDRFRAYNTSPVPISRVKHNNKLETTCVTFSCGADQRGQGKRR